MMALGEKRGKIKNMQVFFCFDSESGFRPWKIFSWKVGKEALQVVEM